MVLAAKVWKRKGWSHKRRILILTSKPRLFYISASNLLKYRGAVPWTLASPLGAHARDRPSTHSLTPLLTYSLLLTHSLTHSYSLTHSLTLTHSHSLTLMHLHRTRFDVTVRGSAGAAGAGGSGQEARVYHFNDKGRPPGPPGEVGLMDASARWARAINTMSEAWVSYFRSSVGPNYSNTSLLTVAPTK